VIQESDKGDKSMKTKFSIQKGYSGREVVAIISSAEWLGAMVQWESVASLGTVPIGTVEFCERGFGKNRKDFYPDFLSHRLCREVIRARRGQLYSERFVKDASAWKSSTESMVRPSGFLLHPGDWLVSEVINFRNEWRFYVADGSVVTTGWYAGDDEDLPAPDPGVCWPENFSGAVDFGTMDSGEIALVEAHAPFACGWYGEDHRDYALWQALAWESADWWKILNGDCAKSRDTITP